MDTASLIWGLVFGSIGFGYYRYGKKQSNKAAYFSGIGLMIFPYFVSNIYLLVCMGLGLMALPYFIKV